MKTSTARPARKPLDPYRADFCERLERLERETKNLAARDAKVDAERRERRARIEREREAELRHFEANGVACHTLDDASAYVPSAGGPIYVVPNGHAGLTAPAPTPMLPALMDRLEKALDGVCANTFDTRMWIEQVAGAGVPHSAPNGPGKPGNDVPGALGRLLMLVQRAEMLVASTGDVLAFTRGVA